MEQLLYQYNPQWENSNIYNDFIEREALLNKLISQFDNNQVIFISGLRRVGKTTLMKMLINNLIKGGNQVEHIFYISLDNYLLRDNNLIEIIEEYRKIQNLKYDEKVYLFLDEITYLSDYEIQLKNLVDTGYCKIFVSSSNATFLKSKKPYLTGRSRILEVPSLDYTEYLRFKNIHIRKSDTHLHEKQFLNFLQTGGMPEYVLTNDISYIQELVDDIIYKDIVAQHRLKNPKLLRDFFLLLMERSGKQFSINKMASIIKISTETAKRYLGYFEETYLISLVERHGKTNERLLSPKKIYSLDLGIRNIFTGFRDIGALFENYVYLKLKDYKPKYLYENKTEIDFVIGYKLLVESKFGNAKMNEKQKLLFDNHMAEIKFIVNNYKDIEQILTALNK